MNADRLLHDDFLQKIRAAKTCKNDMLHCLLRVEDYGQASPCQQIETVYHKSFQAPMIWEYLRETL